MTTTPTNWTDWRACPATSSVPTTFWRLGCRYVPEMISESAECTTMETDILMGWGTVSARHYADQTDFLSKQPDLVVCHTNS